MRRCLQWRRGLLSRRGGQVAAYRWRWGVGEHGWQAMDRGEIPTRHLDVGGSLVWFGLIRSGQVRLG